MKKIICIFFLVNAFSFLFAQNSVDEKKVYIKIDSIVNRPNGKIDKRVYFQIVNSTPKDIKIIFDPNTLYVDGKYNTFIADVEEKYKVGQVKALLHDSKGELVRATYSTVTGRLYDKIVMSDIKCFVEKYTLIIKANSKLSISAQIPLIDNCLHCRVNLVYMNTFEIKVNEFYTLQLVLNSKRFLHFYPDAIEDIDSYYWESITTPEPFIFKSVLKPDGADYDIVDYVY